MNYGGREDRIGKGRAWKRRWEIEGEDKGKDSEDFF